MRAALCILLVLTLSACAGYQKGKSAGWGFDYLDTTTPESKENAAWFDSFYGKNHCGVTVGYCEPGDAGYDTSGTFWGTGFGADASGSSHSSGSMGNDSGSSN